jgi:putative transposase
MKRRTRKRIPQRPPKSLDHSQGFNLTWSLDFLRDTLYDGPSFRTLNVIDEGNREALLIEVDTSISAIRLQRAMNELIYVYGKPQAIRIDNGPEISALSLVDWAERQNILLRFIQPGKQKSKRLHRAL